MSDETEATTPQYTTLQIKQQIANGVLVYVQTAPISRERLETTFNRNGFDLILIQDVIDQYIRGGDIKQENGMLYWTHDA